MKKAIIIARCSTNEAKQDVTRQTEELTDKYGSTYDLKHNNALYSYYQSGTKNDSKNEEILKICLDNDIKTIITSEISRISRKMLSSLQFIEKCYDNNINVIISSQNLHTLNDDGSINHMSKMVLNMLMGFAEFELNQTKERLNSGRRKYIKDGGVMGRTKGTKEDVTKTLVKHNDIVERLSKTDRGIKKESIVEIAKLCGGKSTATVMKVKKLWLSDGKKQSYK